MAFLITDLDGRVYHGGDVGDDPFSVWRQCNWNELGPS